MQPGLSRDRYLHLLPGIRGPVGQRFVDRLEQRRCVTEQVPGRLTRELALRQLEQVFSGRIGIADIQIGREQRDSRRQKLKPGVFGGMLFDDELKRLTGHRTSPAGAAMSVAISAPERGE